LRIVAHSQAEARPLTITALTTFLLATDCSDTVASGTIEPLLLVVRTANKDVTRQHGDGWYRFATFSIC
jgi:hypothetical protein